MFINVSINDDDFNKFEKACKNNGFTVEDVLSWFISDFVGSDHGSDIDGHITAEQYFDSLSYYCSDDVDTYPPYAL